MERGQLNPRQFELFRDLIYQKSGIRVDERKVTLLSNRIGQRLRAGQFTDYDAYYRFLKSPGGGGEVDELLDVVTTNETFFFRTPKHFDWLKSTFIADLLAENRQGKRQKSFQIWSAGCATGAEPYTIAICLAENLFRLRGWEWTILGTDISEQCLRSARAGVFKQRPLEGVSEAQLRRYFKTSKEEETWTVRPEIRAQVLFEKHNLLHPMRKGPFDCIFIRNVLIYFDRDSKITVVQHLMDALAKGGRLVVGPSEGIYDMLSDLRRESAFLYRKD